VYDLFVYLMYASGGTVVAERDTQGADMSGISFWLQATGYTIFIITILGQWRGWW
jgi:hypothetical protein